MRGKRGFTLLELLLVMFIIGVLVAGVIATFGPAARIRAYQAQMDNTLGVLRVASAGYFQEYGAYGSMAQLVSSGYLQTDPNLAPGATVSYAANTDGSVRGTRTANPYNGGFVDIDSSGVRTTGGW